MPASETSPTLEAAEEVKGPDDNDEPEQESVAVVEDFEERPEVSEGEKGAEAGMTPLLAEEPAVTKPSSEEASAAVYQSAIISNQGNQLGRENESRKMREEDDGEGWITSSNFHDQIDASGFITASSKRNTKKKQQQQAEKATEERVTVACYTSDFTMQNLLLQLGLSVLSAEGMLVRTVKKFVLRCNACFTVHTKDIGSRLFCSRCGSNFLSRISASVEEGGQLRLHLKKNYRLDTTGMKYSVPAPGKQDRFQGELLFREDQLLQGIWRQKVVKINKDVKSAFGEDVTSDVGLHLNKQEKIVIGLGKGNPNARKGRERRGKPNR